MLGSSRSRAVRGAPSTLTTGTRSGIEATTSSLAWRMRTPPKLAATKRGVVLPPSVQRGAGGAGGGPARRRSHRAQGEALERGAGEEALEVQGGQRGGAGAVVDGGAIDERERAERRRAEPGVHPRHGVAHHAPRIGA